ncbi:MAG: ASCH domain-containing protein [Clostridiales bacterium]|nr:ASCH domain-containing protein [Clostridiales bacterium]MBS5877148.1 ASCH domain-containing protein [Clostridiales bacterium]MDU0939011.1 ASCH domain-containing protein [Clostridiales bacterium]MDU1041854.1 ASCH domain-containing protein [Clostridiales bacterium]MDU3489478.1 ASCH domain-containing protein [Clostridiales bacterium]
MTANELWEIFKKEERISGKEPFIWNFKEEDDYKVELILKGRKRGDAYLKDTYEEIFGKGSQEGRYRIVVDSKGDARCIVKVTRPSEDKFINARFAHAYLEGEGDRMLSSWRKTYQEKFSAELEKKGKEFSNDVIVVCDEYALAYK